MEVSKQIEGNYGKFQQLLPPIVFGQQNKQKTVNAKKTPKPSKDAEKGRLPFVTRTRPILSQPL